MPESFKTSRYEDRASSKIGFAGYLTQHVPFVLAPLIGFVAGIGLRKTTKIPLLEEVAEGGFGAVRSKASREALRNAANASANYIMRKAEAWGVGLGGMIATFHLWRSNTKQQLEVEQVNKAVESLRGMESANQFLQQENTQLRHQIKYFERHQASGSHASRLEASREEAGDIQR